MNSSLSKKIDFGKPGLPAESLADFFGALALPRDLYFPVLGDEFDRARQHAVLGGERILVGARVEDGDVLVLAFLKSRDCDVSAAGRVFVVAVTARAGDPDLLKSAVHGVHRNDVPFLVDCPSV